MYLGPACRVSETEATFYGFAVYRVRLALYKHVNNVLTTLSEYAAGPNPQTGDTFRLECEGTTLRAYHNGTIRMQATDASIASGRGGVFGFSGGDLPHPTLRLFMTDDLNAPPPPPERTWLVPTVPVPEAPIE